MPPRIRHLPETAHARPGLIGKLIIAFVAGAAVSGTVVALVSRSGSGTAPPGRAATTIAMGRATALDCGQPVAPGTAHPEPILSELFSVGAGAKTYTLGWQIIPFRGAARTYTFGQGGNLLALEPETGGRPLGYGTGTLTFGATTEKGTIEATVALRAGGSVAVRGSWDCTHVNTPSSSVPTTPGL